MTTTQDPLSSHRHADIYWFSLTLTLHDSDHAVTAHVTSHATQHWTIHKQIYNIQISR